MKLLKLLFVLACGLSASLAQAATIGLFSTPDCSSCNLSIAPGTAGTFYISYMMEGRLSILGAEFRVVGLPPDWQVLSVIPSPEATVYLGNPMGLGTNIAFSHSVPGEYLSLFTVRVFATQPASDVILEVTKHTTPSNPGFPCPFVIFDCGEPCDSWGCVRGGRLFINSSSTCSLPVVPSTWSQVRALYR